MLFRTDRRRPDLDSRSARDLTRNDKSKQKWSGGPITGDNTGVEVYGTIFALAESPKQKGLLWAGSDDGLVHVTRDGGKTWDERHGRPQGPAGVGDGRLHRAVAASTPTPPTSSWTPTASTTCKPYLFVTTDGGKTWKRSTAKLPQDVFLQRRPRGPEAEGTALPRHRAAALALLDRRRRDLDAAEAEPADRRASPTWS